MSVKVNGINIPNKIGKVVTNSGLQLSEINTLSGKVLWRASNPFYWLNGTTYIDEYPTKWTITDAGSSDGCDWGFTNHIHELSADAGDNNGEDCYCGWGISGYAIVNTQGNQYMEIIIDQSHSLSESAGITVNGTLVFKPGIYTFDVSSNDTITLYVNLSNWGGGYLYIKSIRFY